MAGRPTFMFQQMAREMALDKLTSGVPARLDRLEKNSQSDRPIIYQVEQIVHEHARQIAELKEEINKSET